MKNKRLLSKLAVLSKVRGEATRRTAVYTPVHEDSSTASTKQFANTVEFRKKSAGFTLIEVLIALAILTIALTAIIKSTSQNIKDTLYIQQKTIALWVGYQITNEVIAGIRKLPAAPDVVEDQTIMLNEIWPWKASLKSTPNPRIQEINVDVYHKKDHLIHLMSYLYAQ